MKAMFIILLTVLYLLLGGVAQAQWNLGTNPEQPTANLPTDFLATFSGCPPQPVENIDGLYFELRVHDFEIDLFYSVNFGVPCGVPPDGPSLAFNMGILPQGDYTLRSAGISDQESFPADMTGLDPVVFEFTVGEPIPQPVPALNMPAALIMVLIMMSGMLLLPAHLRRREP
ncbi:MAG: hypothetical protein PF630_11440 [Gammaproteobacteria bacterium]|jgi:hypothetical protein|nr:hypothetical protein [Gammaproteobacteria bacterium]